GGEAGGLGSGGVLLDEPAGGPGSEERLAFGDDAERAQEIRGLGVLDEEAAGSGTQRLEHVLVEIERGEDDDAHRGELAVLGDGPGGGETIGAGHANVHQHDVGTLRPGQGHGLVAVTGFPDDFDVGLGVEECPQPPAYQRLIISEHDADHAGSPRGSSARTAKPRPGRGPAESSPPTEAARSRIPAMPFPPLGTPSSLGEAAPSSSTSTVSDPLPTCTRTTASGGRAWRATLVSDSCTMR